MISSIACYISYMQERDGKRDLCKRSLNIHPKGAILLQICTVYSVVNEIKDEHYRLITASNTHSPDAVVVAAVEIDIVVEVVVSVVLAAATSTALSTALVVIPELSAGSGGSSSICVVV